LVGHRGFGARLRGEKPIIGVIHLKPLPGSPGYSGSMDEIVEEREGKVCLRSE